MISVINNLKGLVYGLILFFIIFDSSGVLYIRNIILSVLMALGFILFFLIRERISLYIGIIVCFILLALTSLSTVLNGGDIFSSLKWVVSLVAFIPLIMIFREIRNINLINIVSIMIKLYFSVYVIMYALMLYSAGDFALFLSDIGLPGFFRYEDGVIVLYLQSILVLSVFFPFLLFNGKFFDSLLLIIIFLLSSTDFALIIVFFTIVVKHTNTLKTTTKLIVNFFLLFVTLIYVAFFVIYISTLPHENCYLYYWSGTLVRYGHLISIVEYFINNPGEFIFGMGGDSYLYSYGTCDNVNNTEISQLEILRKYGILFVIIYHLAIFYVFKEMQKNKGHVELFSLFSLYLSFLSNPGLLGITSVFVSALMVAESRKNYDICSYSYIQSKI